MSPGLVFSFARRQSLFEASRQERQEKKEGLGNDSGKVLGGER